jgi:hypothetical protein
MGRNLIHTTLAGRQIFRSDWLPPQGGRYIMHRIQNVQDADLRNLLRLISACTLGLWAFAAGLLIGTYLFS